jgi:uncharacterized membrane protein
MAVRFSHFVPVEVQSSQKKPAPVATLPQPAPSQPVESDQLRLSASHSAGPKFGSHGQDKDKSFDEFVAAGKQLSKTTKSLLKSLYKKTKEKAKKELAKPNSEKKAAALAGAVGFVAAELATCGATGGTAGTTVATTVASAVGGYVGTKALKQHQQKKQQAPEHQPLPAEECSDSEEESKTK